jgi:hypothetical protein
LKTEKNEDNIKPNAPRRLVALWRKLGRSDRRVAEEREVNHYYVSQLLWRGIEPGNQEIADKLFVRRKPLKPRGPDIRPEWLKIVQKGIRLMRTETTRDILRRWRNDNEKKGDNHEHTIQ